MCIDVWFISPLFRDFLLADHSQNKPCKKIAKFAAEPLSKTSPKTSPKRPLFNPYIVARQKKEPEYCVTKSQTRPKILKTRKFFNPNHIDF